MDDDEDRTHLVALGELVAKYDALDMTLVADVMQHCNHDPKKAFDVLSEMVIPHEAPTNTSEHAAPDILHTPASVAKQVGPTGNVCYAVVDDYVVSPEFAGFYDTEARANSPPRVRASSEPATSPAQSTPLRGAWAQKSMGRRYRIDKICRQYEWISRSVVEGLFDKYGDCVELVENDILHMFPVDEPQAFGGGQDPASDPTGQTAANGSRTTDLSYLHRSSKHRAIAESLREQAAREIQQDSLRPESISASSKGMDSLRRQLWEARNTRARLQQLANQTRKPAHIAEAKQKENELQRLSTFFLGRLRQSEEYRNGVIDLHGLTREESLQLVRWKVEDTGGRRFRVITGRGTHSHNGQAVLRPALERYFRTKGISFSQYADGIMSVAP